MRSAYHIALGGLCLLLIHGLAEGSWTDRDGVPPDAARNAVDDPSQGTRGGQAGPGQREGPPERGTPASPTRSGGSQPSARAGAADPARPTAPQPRPPAPTVPGTAAPSAAPTTPPLFVPPTSARADSGGFFAPELAGSPLAAPGGDYGSLAGISSGGIPQMIGDLGPLPSFGAVQQRSGTLPSPFPPPRPPGVPRPRGATMVVPSIRGIKVSENQSPRPQDRVFFTFNYFQGVNDQANQKLQAPIGYTQVFRYIGGFEKTFLDGQGSIGLRMPIDTVTAASGVPKQYGNLGGTSTAVGDLSLFAKYILLEDRSSGSLLSGGLALSLPTGPGRFAGFNSFAGVTHTTSIQPFLGYIVNSGRLYFQGFSILDVATNSSNPTLFYNDFGIGYLVHKPDPNSGLDPFISLIAPTFEVHVNTPLNHRDWYNPRDPAGTMDQVNLTYGLNVGIRRRTLLTFAMVTPVSSPRPFDFETMAFVNVFFGGKPTRAPLTPPPVAGGY